MVDEAVLQRHLDINAENLAQVQKQSQEQYATLAESLTQQQAVLKTELRSLRSQQKQIEEAKKNKQPPLLSPLDRIYLQLVDIKKFLGDRFKKTGLGTEDTNKGLVKPIEKDKEEKKEDVKVEKEGSGSLWVSGVLAAAAAGLAVSALKAIKEKLNETWTGLTQSFLKPFVTLQLAIGKMPALIKVLNKNFPRLSKFILDTVGKFKTAGKAVGKFFKPVTDTLQKAIKPVSKVLKTMFNSVSKLTGGFGFGKLFNFVKPLGSIFKKLALPVTLVLEAFEAFKMMFVGSFSKNAEDLAESISEKGVIGRAFYGFTHMFQTVATAMKTQFDTMMTTLDILFSDHPDGMVGKLLYIGEIILTPIKELFLDFVVYPIQKALSYIPGLGVPDPDKAKVDKQRTREEALEAQERAKEIRREETQKKADKYGVSFEEYRAYQDYREEKKRQDDLDPNAVKGVKSFMDWKENSKKINETTSIPTPEISEANAMMPSRQSVINQTAVQTNNTYELKPPLPHEVFMNFRLTPAQ